MRRSKARRPKSPSRPCTATSASSADRARCRCARSKARSPSSKPAGKVQATTVNEGIRLSNVYRRHDRRDDQRRHRHRERADVSLEASTVNGDVTFNGTIRDNGVYRLDTHGGDIRVGLGGATNATVFVRTFQGDFSADFPVQLPEGQNARSGSKRFNFTLGSRQRPHRAAIVQRRHRPRPQVDPDAGGSTPHPPRHAQPAIASQSAAAGDGAQAAEATQAAERRGRPRARAPRTAGGRATPVGGARATLATVSGAAGDASPALSGGRARDTAGALCAPPIVPTIRR